jgi:hypothetical protein
MGSFGVADGFGVGFWIGNGVLVASFGNTLLRGEFGFVLRKMEWRVSDVGARIWRSGMVDIWFSKSMGR